MLPGLSFLLGDLGLARTTTTTSGALLLSVDTTATVLLAALVPPLLVGPTVAGSAAGAVNPFWQLGSVIVPAVIGPVFAATGSFAAAFATLAAGPVLGAVVALFSARPRLRGSSAAQRPGAPDRPACTDPAVNANNAGADFEQHDPVNLDGQPISRGDRARAFRHLWLR